MPAPVDPEAAAAFYLRLLQALKAQGLPFLVGGAYGFAHFTGIRRPTKDLDIFIRHADWERLVALAEAAGWRAELTFPHWLGKVIHGEDFVDVIFNSGNGLSPVDEAWFQHAVDAHVLGEQVKLAPVEESLWTKAFIMERERYDGADVAHLLHACALRIDWPRLLRRFGAQWRVLLSHLVLFGFIYPGERHRVPTAVMDTLLQRLHDETHGEPERSSVCQGTLLSREQFLPDVAQDGYDDVRLSSHSSMTREDVAIWTAAIGPTPSCSTDTAPPAVSSGTPVAAAGSPGDDSRRRRTSRKEKTMTASDPNRAASPQKADRRPDRPAPPQQARGTSNSRPSPGGGPAKDDITQAPESGEKPAVMPPAGTARR